MTTFFPSSLCVFFNGWIIEKDAIYNIVYSAANEYQREKYKRVAFIGIYFFPVPFGLEFVSVG